MRSILRIAFFWLCFCDLVCEFLWSACGGAVAAMYSYVEIWIPLDSAIFSPSGTRIVTLWNAFLSVRFVMAYGIIIYLCFDPSDPAWMYYLPAGPSSVPSPASHRFLCSWPWRYDSYCFVCVCVALFTGQMQKKHHIMCHFANNLLASIFPILQSPPDYDVVKWCETSVLNGMILLVLARFIQMHCLSSRSRCPRKKHEATSSVSFMDALGWAAMTILVLFFYF